MSEGEIALFDKYIKHSKNYLEFGSGGSTIRALLKSRTKVYSVDSDIKWINKLRAYFLIRLMELRRLKFLFVFIGNTSNWGYPINNDQIFLFPNYSAQVFKKVKKEKIDLIFIDGRFRVACVLKSVLECYLNRKLKIIIHDFWVRPCYHIVLNYLIEIERANTIGVFKIMENIDLDSVARDYEIYKFIPE
jgi:hypothetical protein